MQIMKLEYDHHVYNELKQIPNSIYDSMQDIWMVDASYLKCFADNIKDYDKDVANKALDLVTDSVPYNTYEKELLDENVKSNKMTILNEKKAFIEIDFAFDYSILNILKSIEKNNRKFDAKTKTWSVRKEVVTYLVSELEKLKYVDVSELKQFQNNRTDDVTLKEFPDMKFTPYPFQVDVAKRMLKSKKVINSLEAGLGKTVITIMAAETTGKNTIVVCPASVKQNWKKEIKNVNPNASIQVLEGKSTYEKNKKYTIVNFDIIDRFTDDIKADNKDVMVMDEGHKIRSINTRGKETSKRSKVCLDLSENMEYVFPLTATPFVNYTKDIFNLLKATKHSLSYDWYGFANEFCAPNTGDYGTSYNGSSNQDKLNERLYIENGMIRMKSEDYLDLPERVRSFIPIDINLNQYHKSIDDYMANRDNLTDKGEHLVYFTTARKMLAKEKAKQAVHMIKDVIETGKSVVVFTNYTEVIEYLHNRFEDESLIIYGETTSKQRQQNVDMFQNGDKPVIIGNIEAMGEGLTLTQASEMIVIDFHWSPIFMTQQMEKRIHRIGQDLPVKINYLYAQGAKMDEIIAESAERKMNDSSAILDGKQESFLDDIMDRL